MKSLIAAHRFIIALVPAIMLTITNEALAQQQYPYSNIGIRAGGNVNRWTNDFPSLEYKGGLVYPEDWKLH
jgi:hypothetical protein